MSVRSRRSAGPVRLALAVDLGGDLDGAWWPHTASIARELPELVEALFRRLGEVSDISVNWSALAGPVDYDALTLAKTADPGRVTGHQRLMTVTGSKGPARLLVVPNRTSATLAVMVLRRAADLPIGHSDRDTQAFRTADHIVRAARVECVRCAVRPRDPVS